MNKLDYGSGRKSKKGFKTSDFSGLPGYDYFIKDYKVLDTEDHSFDVINCRNVIHHIPENDLSKLFNEFNRLLKEDGFLIISEPREDYHEQNKLLDTIWYRWITIDHSIMIPDKYVDYKKYLDKFEVVTSYNHINNEVIVLKKKIVAKELHEYDTVAV